MDNFKENCEDLPPQNWSIDVVIGPLKEDGTYTVQIGQQQIRTFNDSDVSREKMVQSLEPRR